MIDGARRRKQGLKPASPSCVRFDQQRLELARMLGAVALSTLLLVADIGISSAEPLGQIQNDHPRPLVATAGPSSRVQSVAFDPSGERFFVGGNDKFVQAWSLHEIGDGNVVDCTATSRYYWEIARGPRGNIHAMAVSSDGRWLVFGGHCARDSNGDVQVFDLSTGKLEKVLTGHDQIISAISFSEDDEYLLVCMVDGESRLWKVGEWNSTRIPSVNSKIEPLCPAMFLDDELFAVPRRIDAEWWRIDIRSMRSPTRVVRTLQQPHRGYVTAFAREPNSHRWASADAMGNVFVWDAANSLSARLLRDAEKVEKVDTDKGETYRSVRGLAFDAHGRVFVTTSTSPTRPSVAELWSVTNGRKLDERILGRSTEALIAACDPAGKFFVTVEEGSSSLALIELHDREGELLDRPLTVGRTTRRKSRGSDIWKVAFDAGSTYRIRYASKLKQRPAFSDYGEFDRAFDFDNLTVLSDESAPKQVVPHDDGGSWSLSSSNNREISLLRNGVDAGTITLDRNLQGVMTCYCWLKDANGTVYGIAIGTQGTNGIFLYGLPQRGSCRMMRYLRDHSSSVTSVGISHDGRYLVSGSTDQTIKVWSLAELRNSDRFFDRVDAWGAVLRRQGDKVAVERVFPGSIAERRGLRQGDMIVMAMYNDSNGREQDEIDPDKMLEIFESYPLWDNLALSVAHDKETQRILLVVAWEPLVTLYVDERAEWVAWTPEGIYDASAEGDSALQWVINKDRMETPDVVPTNQLRGDLQQHDLMRELLSQGDLGGTLERAGMELPKNRGQFVVDASQNLPQVSIVTPRPHERIPEGQSVEVRARIVFPDEAAMDRYDIECFVNGAACQDFERQDQGTESEFRWVVDRVTGPLAKALVIAMDRYAGANTRFSMQEVFFMSDTKPDPYRVRLVTISGSEYINLGRDNWLHGEEDAKRFESKLRDAAGAYYEIGDAIHFDGDQASREKIESFVERMSQPNQELDRDDLLIIYVAGHGVLYESEYYFIPVTWNVQDSYRDSCISWRTIREFGRIPCRKLYLIDTCMTVEGASTPDLNKLSESKRNAYVRPLNHFDSLVVTSAQAGQKALEFDGQGLFNRAVLECLEGKADGAAMGLRPAPPDPDGTTDLTEIKAFLPARVREIAEWFIKEFPEDVDDEARELLMSQRPFVSDSYLPHIPLLRN